MSLDVLDVKGRDIWLLCITLKFFQESKQSILHLFIGEDMGRKPDLPKTQKLIHTPCIRLVMA